MVCGALALLVFGCGDSPDPSWLVTKERLIAITARVVGEPERATPRPGETVEFTLEFVDADADAPSTWAFLICEAETTSGVPFCREDSAIEITDIELDPAMGGRPMSVTIPADFEGSRVLVTGAVCMGGRLDITGIDLTSGTAPTREELCIEDDAEGQLAFFSHPIEQSDRSRSLSPVFSQIRFGGEPWLETDLTAGCTDGLPTVAIDDMESVIELERTEGSRESYPALDADGMEITAMEEIRLAIFATDGGLQRQFSTFTETNPIVEVDWEPPLSDDDPPFEGDVVRFWFVLRDLRGGYATTARALCVNP